MVVFAALVAGFLLIAISALHLAWAAGATWPAEDETALALRVAGFRGVRSMPPRGASVAVAMALAIAAHIVFAAAGLMPGIAADALYRPALMALALVFTGRGLAPYTPQWRALTPEQPFARLDRRYYGPLCLLIAALCAVVLFA